ncbi:MAG: tRNA 5-methoxyuridine(34)/uridine 5-oxyacetic acid(34) synthase CmoB [Victivallaceae bacterium]
MMDYEDFLRVGSGVLGTDFARELYASAVEKLQSARHGDFARWLPAAEQVLNGLTPGEMDATGDVVKIACQLNGSANRDELIKELKSFSPWRKGPFQIGDIYIDTEWRSDFKWNRLKEKITSLNGRRVLDIGCGSGYHLHRMTAAGAKIALGIEPYWLFALQFELIRALTLNPGATFVLPLTFEELPEREKSFDTIFSMGVIYHRRAPLEHLQKIYDLLTPGGELVLESMVVDGDESCVFMPPGRYAKMRNVWFLPSPPALQRWLRRIGFVEIEQLECAKTELNEQRATEWMQFESLADFLSPDNPELTVEGAPAPKRCVIIAHKRKN